MRHTIMRYLFALCFILPATGFSLFDMQSSYAQFERLLGATRTDGGRVGVSFRFKTYAKTGLLFYVDDEGLGEYLTFYLRDGFLVLELGDGSGKAHKARTNLVINDLEWHRIEVELSSHHAVCRLDNATLAEFNITDKIQLKSDVFFGGFPHDLDIFSLSLDSMMFEERFLGCVDSVQFSYRATNSTQIRSAKIVKSSGMHLECKDACKPQSPCRNDGVCINKFAMAECSCSETGHYGATCEKESPVVGISSGDHRVIFEIPSSFIATSSETTSMFVRFRSSQPDGVFFYTTHKGDYILLELTNGKVAASVSLGSGSVTIATTKAGYNDNQWHRVKLKRVKRLVNLTVDNLDRSRGKTRGKFDKFHFSTTKTSFVLGGLAEDKKTKMKSVSRKNFTGCLQELTFNGYDLFWKYNTSAKEVVSYGNILKTCPKAPTQPPTTTKMDIVLPTNKSTTVFSTLKITKSSKVSTTGQKLPCILAGISCGATTTGTPTSQAHFVTSAPQISSGNPNSTSGKSFSTNEKLSTTSKARIQSTIDANTPKTTFDTKTARGNAKTFPDTSLNQSKDENIRSTTSGQSQTTGGVIMASSNERSEGDLTVWFILAAAVGVVAFLLAILIIVKMNSGNKRKYAVKGKKYGGRDYWSDTGSFQRSSKPLV